MGFFDRLYYGKAGKRDYTEMDMPKTRVSLFFLVLKDHFFDLVKVNLLQVVFWIPFLLWTYMSVAALQNIDAEAMITVENGSAQLLGTMSGYVTTWLVGCIPCLLITGPSSAGSAYIMRNWARDQHAFLFSDFKDAFKSNWKQALGVSVITAFVPAIGYTAVSFYAGMAQNSAVMLMPLVAYTALLYYGQLASSNLVMVLPLIVVFSAAFVWTLMLPLLYPMMIGYELGFRHLLKNAMLMALARLPHMMLARLITLVPIAVLLLGLYMGNLVVILIVSLYYILFGFALSRLVYASFANSVFDKYLNPHIEGASVRQGLRPETDEDEFFDDDDEDEEEYEEDEEEA